MTARWLHVLSAAAVVGAVAACSGGSSVFTAEEPAVPTAGMRNGSCIVDHTASGGRGGVITVGPAPSGVTLVWLPGLNQRPCQAVSTHQPAQVAQELAADIRRAPPFPDGESSCPADDASAVTLYFEYGSGHPLNLATVGLTGCRAVSAPGKHPRSVSDALVQHLRNVAPGPWKAALPSRP